MESSSPQEDSTLLGYRGRSQTKFLPLNSDDALTFSTRGQNLQSVMMAQSQQRKFSMSYKRRPTVDPEARDEEEGPNTPARSLSAEREGDRVKERRMSSGAKILMTPEMRSKRLIGSSNPRYQWQNYFKSEQELKKMKKPIREYYERTNSLIEQYLYVDRLLDSSLPHNLLQEYSNSQHDVNVPATIQEESTSATNGDSHKVKRTPRNLYRVPDENTALLASGGGHAEEDDDDAEDSSSNRIVTIAIYINLAANTILLAGKIVVALLTNSLSVLASLVDAGLDFLSTAIIWVTTRLIARQDQYAYPIGRRRLEPLGVVVFSVVMVTSFVQVFIECFRRLIGDDESIVQLTVPAIIIMASTVLIKFACWLYCRLIKNSSVQALAQDAMTDVVFNIFSIIFPLVGFYFKVWWLDALGGLLLSLYVIIGWSRTSAGHIRNLSGCAASADERNVLLYLTMRFAKTIKQIQGLQAYHVGDSLNVEVDVVLDEGTSLRDSHDLGESLQYVLESVPTVDRAFVHLDYASWNLPSHMQQN